MKAKNNIEYFLYLIQAGIFPLCVWLHLMQRPRQREREREIIFSGQRISQQSQKGQMKSAILASPCTNTTFENNNTKFSQKITAFEGANEAKKTRVL